MALSAKEMGDAIIRNLKEKTGKSLEEWLAAVPDGIGDDKNKVLRWLKEEYGLGHYQAVTIWKCSQNQNDYADEKAIELNLFGPENSKQHQLYRTLRECILALGSDVISIACKTYIPFKRKKQFAILAPSPSGIRLGLALEGNFAPHGFQPAKNMGGSDRINFFTEIHDSGNMSESITEALTLAYNQNG